MFIINQSTYYVPIEQSLQVFNSVMYIACLLVLQTETGLPQKKTKIYLQAERCCRWIRRYFRQIQH
jgi:hypothetical protein